MEEQELLEKIEQLRQNRGNRRTEYEAWENRQVPEIRQETLYAEMLGEKQPREDGMFGVITFQGILAVILAITYLVMQAVGPEISRGALEEVRKRSGQDFSFRDQVYETVGNLLTYLNEIQPVQGRSPEDPASSDESRPSDNPNAEDSRDQEISSGPEGSPASGETGMGGEYTPVEESDLPENATFAPVIFTGRITFPLRQGGKITSGFGFREHPLGHGEDFHLGIDIAAPCGTNVLAAADGLVRISQESGSLGQHIVLDHGGGFETVYGHCDRLLAPEGAWIREGEVIAKVGSTGASTGYHLHFAMKKNGLYVDPACGFAGLSEAEKSEGIYPGGGIRE